jgi:hypothetical protein
MEEIVINTENTELIKKIKNITTEKKEIEFTHI